MKLIFATLLVLSSLRAFANEPVVGPQAAPQAGLQAVTSMRLLVSATRLADGATLELKSVIGGALLTIEKEERGEIVESSIQSVTNNEAANLRGLIANAQECPVALTFVQNQLVQAKAICQ